MDRGAWRATYSPWGCKELDMTETAKHGCTHGGTSIDVLTSNNVQNSWADLSRLIWEALHWFSIGDILTFLTLPDQVKIKSDLTGAQVVFVFLNWESDAVKYPQHSKWEAVISFTALTFVLVDVGILEKRLSDCLLPSFLVHFWFFSYPGLAKTSFDFEKKNSLFATLCSSYAKWVG